MRVYARYRVSDDGWGEEDEVLTGTVATATKKVGKRPPGRPPKSDGEKAAERSLILDAARRSIREEGPDISLEEIAAAAKVGKPKIYAHFTDKAGLADALAVEVARELEARAASRYSAEGAETPADLYRLGVDAFTKFIADDTNLYRFMVRSIKTSESDVFDNVLLLALQSRTAGLIHLVYPSMDAQSREIASYASNGQIFAACEGWLQHRRYSRRKLVDSLVRLFAQGISALAEGESPVSRARGPI